MTDQLKQSKLCFIGGGNMAAAIIGGLLAKDIPKDHIYVAEPWDVNRNKMSDLGVHTSASNVEASQTADLLVLAVKPQVAQTACTELAAAWTDRESLPLIICIAAGITLESLKKWTTTSDGRTPHVVRVMPNTPALVGEGASGLYAGDDVTESERELATALLGSVSKAAEWVDKEELLDVVTGLSGKSLFPKSHATTDIYFRIWPCLLLRHGRAPHLQRNRPGSFTRAGQPSGQADMPGRGQDARRVV